jgi:hypothetical protein
LLSFFLSIGCGTLYAQEIIPKKKTTNWFKTSGLVKVTKKDLERKVKDSISPSDTIIKATKTEESIFRRESKIADKYAKLIKRTNLLLCMIRQNSIIKI